MFDMMFEKLFTHNAEVHDWNAQSRNQKIESRIIVVIIIIGKKMERNERIERFCATKNNNPFRQVGKAQLL